MNGWKWVRITNEEECHNGFQYQTGVNADTKPFNSETICGDGLYFCKQQDVVRWIGDGQGFYIREVIIPDSDSHTVVIDFNLHAAKTQHFQLLERQDLWTHDFCRLAVQQNGLALGYIPIEKRTVELCKLAIQQNMCALQFVPLNCATDDFWDWAVQQKHNTFV